MPSHRVVPGANPTDAPDDRQAMRRARARVRGDAPVVVPRPRRAWAQRQNWEVSWLAKVGMLQ
jgi:hypothetical protein